MAHSQSAEAETVRGEWWAWLWAVSITVVGMALLYTFVQRTAYIVPEEPWLMMWLELAVLVTGGLLLSLWVLLRHGALKFTLSVALVSFFLTFIVLATLQATPYTLDALSGDQGLYTAYVTKFAAYTGNVDVVYANLPAFYPPLYFYLLGRLSAWLHIAPYQMLKFGLLGTTLLLPFLLSWSWRHLVALPLATAAAFTLLVEQQWYKPAEWLTMVLFVPWWLHWVENCTAHPIRHWPQRLRWWSVGGLFGAILFQAYYYWFFIGAISLLLQLLPALLRPSTRRSAWSLVTNAVPMLISTAAFSAIYWVPYLYSMARSGGWQVLQNRWFAQGQLALPLPFAENSFAALLLLVGVLFLAFMAERNRVMRSLLYFLAATYGWLALGYVGLLANTPLVSFRAYPLATYVPALGIGFAIAALWQRRTQLMTILHREFVLARPIATLGLVVVLFFAQNTVLDWSKNEDVPKAIAMSYPAEQLAALDGAIAGVSNELSGGISGELSTGEIAEVYKDKTILLSRDYVDWVAYRPLFTFLAWSAHYSHPAALFYDRVALLEQLTTVHSAQLFAAALFHNRYDHIDHLLLKAVDGGWQMTFLDDNFPNRNLQRTLTFADANLTTPYFVATPAGALTLLTPDYAVEPLPLAGGVVPEAMATAPLSAVATRYTLARGFGPHLAGNGIDAQALETLSEARLTTADLSLLSTSELLDLYQFAAEPLRTRAYKALTAELTASLDQQLADQNGAPKLQVIGYTLEPGNAEQPPIISIDLEVLARLDWDYTVWFHAIGGDGKETLDFAPLQPTTTWLPGQVIRLRRTLPLAPGAYELLFGFWRSAEDVRLVLPSGEVGVALGTVDVP